MFRHSRALQDGPKREEVPDVMNDLRGSNLLQSRGDAMYIPKEVLGCESIIANICGLTERKALGWLTFFVAHE